MGFWENVFGRNKGSRRRTIRIKHPKKSARRQFRIDPLESRYLLSADIIAPAAVLDPSILQGEIAAVVMIVDDTTDSGSSDSPVLSDRGQLLDIAFNSANGEILLANTQTIDRIDSSTGAVIGSIDVPGTDVTEALGLQILDDAIPSFNGEAVDAGSLLVFNGGPSPDTVVVLDPESGAQLSALDLSEEMDPVGGVFHGTTGTFFVLDSIHDEIVELDPHDGTGISRFAAPFEVGSGGIAIHPLTGNLWIGSSESDAIAEVSTGGELLRLVDVHAFGVDSNLSGLAFKNRYELLVSTTDGDVFTLPDPLVNMPTNVSGNAGTTVTISVNIDNAAGLESVDIGSFSSGLPGITYDTALLDATNASIRAGTVLPAGSTIISNVNDTAGTMFIAVSVNPATPITVFNGSIILIDFQIKSTAPNGTTKVDLRNVSLNEGGLILTQVPRAGDDPTDGAITIGTPDPSPSLSINDIAISEGNSGTTTATFTITRSGSTTGSSSAQVQTADGTAAAGSDYVAFGPTTVNFAAGETTKTVAITVNGDTTFETNETFVVNLSNPTDATISDNQGVGTINNDDAAPSFSINDIQLTEGNSGTSTATFTVTKSGATELSASVQVQTANDTATAGSDYVAVGLTTLNFAAGELTKTVAVTINGDTTFEGNETFFVNLSNATISDNQGVGTINNDDSAPSFSINDIQLTEGNSGTSTATFTVTKSGSTELSASVQVQTANDTATAGSDYVAVNLTTLSFAPGELTKTVAVTINGDTTVEPDETFFVNLSNATNATVSDGQGIGTILNDDGALSFSINDVTLAEGNGPGTTAFSFTVTLAGVSDSVATVTAQTANGTATSPGDYAAAGPTVLTFNPGVTQQSFTVQVTGDTTFEGNETFFVNLTNPTNATISDNQGVGTINNDDAAPSFSINDVQITEGNSGTSIATFTVTKSGATELSASVQAQTSNDTATAGSDYVAVGLTTLSFAAGELTKTVAVTINGDTTFESNETFFVNLSNATNATISDGQGVGTINNDDAAPSFSINDVQVTEGNSGTSTATFTVTKSGATELSASVQAQTANDTATAGSDYVAVSLTTLNFAAGELTKTVAVTINGDTTFEGNETFSVNLSNATNATISDGQGVGTINNDDAAPSFSINDVQVTEGNSGTSTATFTVTKSGATELSASVQAQTANDTATAGSDYVAVSLTTLNFAAGELTKTVAVTINGDTTFEGNETFFVNLSNATNATISDGQGVGTINNDDAAPSFSINDVQITEGNSGTSTATFTVTKSGATELSASVQAQTANDTATAGSDYVAVSLTTLNFAAGELTKAVAVTINGDTTFEGNETFFVNLSNATNATISDGQGVGTINNDDAAPSFSINDVQITEGNSGTSTATFTVTKSGATELSASVQAQTANDTATAGSDYVAVSLTTLNFAAGELTKAVAVTINGDTIFEGNETFFVNLSNATNATIADGQGVGTINNDDAAPSFSINDVQITEGNSGTSLATFTVTKSGGTELPASVQVQTANDTATASSDYSAVGLTTLNFAAGELTKTVAVTINGDTTVEDNETFFVNLSNATNATISDGQGVGTILNDDGALNFSINDVTLAEGNGPGTTAFSFTVTLAGVSDSVATVTAQTANGTATSPGDYAAAGPTVLTFNPGVTQQSFTVQVTGDTTFEANETFVVNLTSPTNATISDGQGVGTINNDDAAPSFTINDVQVTEGNSGTSTATFTVTKSGGTELSASVQVQTANDTATAGSDYVAVGLTTLSFTAGELTRTVAVTINGDTTFEGNETFFVNLSNASNATISDGQGVGTINNDDAAPSFTINDVQVTEGNSGTSTATFTVTKSGGTELSASVQVQTANDTATAGSDYVAVGLTTLSFTAGELTKTVAVTINGDTTFEGNETFFVNLSNASNATISDSQGVGTINNDDAAPSFSINDVQVAEGNSGTSTATFTVTKSGGTELSASVQVQTANDTATAGIDYVAVGLTTLNFVAGELTKTVAVTINGDTTVENNETFFVNLSNASNATISDGQGLGTILNDDGVLNFSINDVTLAEGNGPGTTAFTFTVTLAGVSDSVSTVTAQTANGTAASPGDYAAAGPTVLTFNPGATQQSFTVQVTGDTTFEGNETFVVNLTNPTNATIADGQGVGTINNDDAAPTFSINDVQITEGNSGTSTATFTVTKSGGTELSASVQVQTANDTATAGSDYVAVGLTTLSFTAGELTKTVAVTINGDTTFEGNETFFVNLSNASNSTISDGQGVSTINNNDTAPSFSINDVQVAEGNSGTSTATFAVTKSGATELSSSVQVQTANDTATAGSDYVAVGLTTLSFAAGELTKTVAVTINGDNTVEANETFFVNLSNAVNATISDSQGVGTINNDDGALTFSINDVTLTEGNGPGTTAFTFTVTLAGVSASVATVTAQTASGTATSPGDYAAAGPTVLTFNPGVTQQSFTLQVTGDTTFEGNETFFVNLTNPTNASISDNQGVGTINNDDAAPSFSINDVQVTEGNSGTSTTTLTVTKSGGTELTASVQVQTANGTASAGSDYVAVGLTTLSFAAGELTKTVAVTINGDNTVEGNETFFVNLSNAVNATISDNQGVGTINNDDTSTNETPVANDDTATTTLLVPVGINVLANDTDDGPLVPSSIDVVDPADNGSVSVNAITGLVTYTPDLGFFGTDSFTYTIEDSSGVVSNEATVTVTVEHDATVPLTTLIPDPEDPSETMLVIVGTLNDDVIRVVPNGKGGGIKVIVNGDSQGIFTPTSRILIFGISGDDNIKVQGKVSLPVEVDFGDIAFAVGMDPEKEKQG